MILFIKILLHLMAIFRTPKIVFYATCLLKEEYIYLKEIYFISNSLWYHRECFCFSSPFSLTPSPLRFYWGEVILGWESFVMEMTVATQTSIIFTRKERKRNVRSATHRAGRSVKSFSSRQKTATQPAPCEFGRLRRSVYIHGGQNPVGGEEWHLKIDYDKQA